MTNQSIIGVGSPVVDDIAQVPEAFLESVDGGKGGMELVSSETLGELLTQLPSPPIASPGGSSGNTLFALARLGVSAAMLGKIGSGDGGEFYRSHFKSIGGDPSRFKVGTVPNGRCLSLVTPDGERTMRTDLGAAMTLTPDEISPDDFSGYNHAHIEGYLLFNRALMTRVLECAKSAGCTVSLDLASYEVVNASADILPALLSESVDIVFANEEEASAFTGMDDDYAAMAAKLGTFCDIAAVKAGALGSWIAAQGKVLHAPAIEVERVVDTTGAGDLWAAGFLCGWSQGKPLEEAAHYGALLGGAVVQIQGTVLPENTWAELNQAISGSAAC